MTASLRRRASEDLDLRFADKEEETAFKKHVELKLIQRVCAGSGLLAVSLLVNTSFEIISASMSGDPVVWSKFEPRIVRLGGSIVQTVLSAVMFSMCMARLRLGLFRTLDWEALVTLCLLLLLQEPILARPSMFPWICSVTHPTDDCSSSHVKVTDFVHLGHEMTSVLFIDLALTVVHFFLPIRSWRSYIFDVIPVCELIVLVSTSAQSSEYILPPKEASISLMALASLAVLAHLLGRSNERHDRDHWRNSSQQATQLEPSQPSKEHEAACKILSSFCDSLVHLGPDFVILKPCPKLDAMLFRMSSIGKSFCDLIGAEDDKHMFVSALRESAATMNISPGMTHLRLADSFGQIAKLYAHYVCYHTSSGEPHFLLALVEMEERATPIAVSPLAPSGLPDLPNMEVFLEMDEDSGDLLILSLSSNMCSILGEGFEGREVEALVTDGYQQAFIQWIQYMFNTASGRGKEVKDRFGFVQIRSHYPHLYCADVQGTFRIASGIEFVTLKFEPPQAPQAMKTQRRFRIAGHPNPDSKSSSSSRSLPKGTPRHKKASFPL